MSEQQEIIEKCDQTTKRRSPSGRDTDSSGKKKKFFKDGSNIKERVFGSFQKPGPVPFIYLSKVVLGQLMNDRSAAVSSLSLFRLHSAL